MKTFKIQINENTPQKGSSGNHIRIPINNELYWEKEFMQDCPNYQYIPSVLPKTDRIIVIGDVHGDLKLAIKSFKLAGLIDDNLNWIAEPKHTVVVQVGDQIDSCRPINNVYDCTKQNVNDNGNDMGVMDFFNLMHKKASNYAGAVYSLLGNHELMNSQKNFTYVSHNNLNGFKYGNLNGNKGRELAFTPGGVVANMMGCTRNSVMIIGSNLFVHAGVLPSIINNIDLPDADNRTKLKYVNNMIRKWLLNKIKDPLDKKNVNNIFDDTNNLFWTRLHGEINKNTSLDDQKCSDVIGKNLELFTIGQMIVGHSPQFMYKKNDGRTSINGTCHDGNNNNRLYRVDNGLSLAFNAFGNNYNVQVLEILNDNIFNILTDINPS